MFAIIETGGKQYRVEQGLEFKVELLQAEAGSELALDKVLLVSADGATKIHAARLMAYHCAWKLDQGGDVRTEISMLKVFATEMADEIIDQAMQCFGAMGMTKEMPLQLLAGRVRNMRIYDGPSEVHRMVVARNLMDTRG